MKRVSAYLIPAAVAVMALTACNGEQNEPEVAGQSISPEFSATIGGLQSRAYDQSWNEGDSIGVNGCGRWNVCYVTAGGDYTFKVKRAGEEIYFPDENSVDFTAYYPRALVGEDVVKITANTAQQSQDSQKTFDFLWGTGKGEKADPEVELKFDHRMAKLTFIVKPGKDISYEEVKAAKLSLKGFRHGGTFNIRTGETETTGDATDSWTFSEFATYNNAERTATFSFIFFPQVLDDKLVFAAELNRTDGTNYYNLRAEIDFTKANQADGNNAKNAWVAGRQYNLSMTLNKTDITVSKPNITVWTVVTPADGDIDVE